jgi:amino acid transporter
MVSEKLNFYPFLVSFTLATGIMLSPDSLTLLGNNFGVMGLSFLVVIPSVMVVHLFTALSYGALYTRFSGPGGEARLVKEALGPVTAMVLPICSRVIFTLFAATGILVSAGFVFNEVFLFWFPNFGFSFIILGFLLAINLLGLKVAGTAQIIFLATAFLALIMLSAVGLAGVETIQASTNESQSSGVPRAILTGLLLFIGYDLAGFGKESDNNVLKSMIMGIVFVGALFCLWGAVSAIYVSPERLSETTIPHIVSAKAILGQKGRILMGTVVIAGTCAAVNALLIAVSRMISGMASHGLLPHFLGKSLVSLLLLAGGSAVMMALGMAGEPMLEVFIRAGLCFWLLNYGAVHLSILIIKRSTDFRPRFFQVIFYNPMPVVGLFLIFFVFVGLLLFSEQPALLLRSMLVIFAIVFVFSHLWTALGRK